MAELLDYIEPHDLPRKRLRLSLRWHRIWTDMAEADEVRSELSIGIFLGDTPLFADAVYDRRPGFDEDWLEPGYFYGEDDRCFLLDGLWNVVTTGERLDFDDILEPTFRLVVAPFLLDDRPVDPKENMFFDVFAVIKYGGPWHGDGMGSAGPAVVFVVKPPDLEKFFYDLLDEALDPKTSDEKSRKILTERLAEASERRRRK